MRQSRGDVVFDTINYAVVSLTLLAVAYPLYFVILASFSDPFAVNRGEVLLWPRGANVLAYREVFRTRQIWQGYGNTFFYAAIGSGIAVAVTLGAAFALSRRELVGRGVFTAGVVFTLIFGGGLVPLFLLVKNLGLYDSRLYILIHSATTAWWIMIARTFLMQLPDELYESARIDGCGDLQFFFRIVLGTSSALIAVLFLLAAVAQWNSYFVALVFLQDKSKFPLQVVLREILVLQQMSVSESLFADDVESFEDALKKAELIKYAILVVASIPVLVFYPFIQRYFVKGVMIGSLKG